jgi:hypothetical protein
MRSAIQDHRVDIEKFKQIFSSFNAHTLAQLPYIYAKNVVFKDPIHNVVGLEALQRYFAGFCAENMSCTFAFTNEITSEEQAFFQWNMRYSHPKLDNGKTLHLQGATLIRFHSHIFYHEDFYDMGAMIYQHIPLVGWAVKKINQRLRGKQ